MRCNILQLMLITPEAAEQHRNNTLVELGARVRAWRARRGMTRKALATDSGLSERFLADVESGKGNVSINSLAAAAQGPELLSQLIQLTGLPEEFHPQLESILLAQGIPVEKLTLDDVRLALMEYLSTSVEAVASE